MKIIRDFCKHYETYKNKPSINLLNINESLISNYLWNQEVNFPELNMSYDFYDSSNTILIDNFINRVNDRFKYLPNVLSQIDYLLKYKSLKTEISNELKEDKKFLLVKEKTKISDVIKISKMEYYMKSNEIFNPNNEAYKFSSFFTKDFSEKHYKKIINSSNLEEQEAYYLCITFERKHYKINAFAEIRNDFPYNSPKFFMTMETVKNNALNIPDNLKEFIHKENNLEEFKAENCGFSHVLRVKCLFI